MTALVSMAAASRPPGIVDARIPCPLCGGLIHPVAGRCKHCKEDLSAFRAGRPQAAAELPALNGLARAPAAATNGTNGHGAAAAAVPVALPVREGSQPILPPRPTGRSMKAASPRSAIWRNWPILVIVLAVGAIVIATIIMVMPEGKSSGKRQLMNPPAPERMETNPLPPKASQADPWGQPGTQPQQPPMPPDDPDDLLGQLPQGGGVSGTGAFMLTMFDKACKKLKSCPNIDTAMLSQACDQFSSMAPPPAAPRNCPAAQRCLDAIDKLSCDQAGASSPLAAVYLITDCTTALNDC